VLITEVMERIYANRLVEHVERLAHHAFRGALWEKSVAYLRQAGSRATTRSANREAVAWLEQAATALHHLPETRETVQLGYDLHLDSRQSLWQLGELDQVLEHLRAAEEQAQALGDNHRQALVAGHLTQYFWLTGDPAQGLESGQRAVKAAATLDDFDLQVFCLRSGDIEGAIRAHQRGLECCQARKLATLIPQMAAGLGYALALAGRVAEGLPFLEQGVEYGLSIRRMDHHPIRLAWLSEGYMLSGRMDAAVDTASRSLTAARLQNERGSEAWILRLFGEIASAKGHPDLAAAETHFRQAMALAEERAMRPLVAHCHLGLGKLYRRTGRRKQAREHLTTATTMYREMGMDFWLTQAQTEMATPA